MVPMPPGRARRFADGRGAVALGNSYAPAPGPSAASAIAFIIQFECVREYLRRAPICRSTS